MKQILAIISAFTVLTYSGVAQEPSKKKPPIGVPSDANLFNGNWYRLYLEEGTWERARQRCATLGGQLVIIRDAPTWAFIRPMAEDISIWLGATDEKTEGLWLWSDGSPMKFKAWAHRQPDNLHRNQHFLRADRNGWDDFEKTGKAVGFICEWKDR